MQLLPKSFAHDIRCALRVSRLTLIVMVLMLAAPYALSHPPVVEPADAPTSEKRKAESARFRGALEMLSVLNKLPVSTAPSMDQRELANMYEALSKSVYFSEYTDSQNELKEVNEQARKAIIAIVDKDQGIRRLLEASDGVERIWIQPQEKSPQQTIKRRWFKSGTLLLRIGRQDQPVDAVAGFFVMKVNAASNAQPTLDLGDADPAYVAIPVDNLPEHARTIPLRLFCSEKEAIVLELEFAPPPIGELSLRFIDGEAGGATPVAAACFGEDNRIFVPDNALMLHEGQATFYRRGGTRPMDTARYWPGDSRQKNAFHIDGNCTLRLPAGSYTLLASKGPEYIPVKERIEIVANKQTKKECTLSRWIDMPARGWYSGDGHVHYRRTDDKLNTTLLTWAQGEDVHLCNVLSFGDAVEEKFPQYAYGLDGSFMSEGFAIIPGQEDPRTSFMGHTLAWNIQKQSRFEDHYYHFDLMFDDVHQQGGLTGHAHVANEMFQVSRDLSMSIPLNKTDFAEICQFGRVGERLFYEFLNLGFMMTASAGSDVPFGDTMGDSRMFVYTGNPFTPQAWFDGVKSGRTFVTLGPMLEFTINNELPGSKLAVKHGDVLRVKARALGETVRPRYLEIVSQGEVIRAFNSNASEISLEFELPVTGSTWIAARCDGAHTTPIYLQNGTQRFWRLAIVHELIAKRLSELRAIEELTQQASVPKNRSIQENPVAWIASIQHMQKRILAARAIYLDLHRQAEEETRLSNQR